jgi:predicted amidohydrolase
MPNHSRKIATNISASTLMLDKDGLLSLRLVQALSGINLVGQRDTAPGFAPCQPSPDQLLRSTDLINDTKPGSLTVLSYNPGLGALGQALTAQSSDRVIVGLAGAVDGTPYSDGNVTLVACKGNLSRQYKVSLASEDAANGIARGEILHMHLPGGAGRSREQADGDAVRWAVLNCHEYTHVDLLRALQDEQIELLVVVTHNVASRLYWEYAIADVHRLFCYVVIVNVAELGGSGVFAPFRKIGGDAKAAVSAGGQIFTAKGLGEFKIDIDLEIGELRRLRNEFSAKGFAAKGAEGAQKPRFAAMLPSEHFIKTGPEKAGAPVVKGVREVPLMWNAARPRVAVAQLDHIGLDVYLETGYRIRNHPSCGEFETRLMARLDDLEARCRSMGPTAAGTMLDFLVFPEVFLPRSILARLQAFSDRLGTTIIGGVDYDGGEGDQNANECVIIRPTRTQEFYRKISRSQYDALSDMDGTRMPMERGDTLWRFVDKKGQGFGVLICYDYSHLDLMAKLNLENREQPLDLVFVVSHNPFSQLYESCCIADSHRFYQHIVMCNVSDYGGSGIFTPLRTDGARQVIAQVGKGVETIFVAELDLEAVRAGRKEEKAQPSEGIIMRQPGVVKERYLVETQTA